MDNTSNYLEYEDYNDSDEDMDEIEYDMSDIIRRNAIYIMKTDDNSSSFTNDISTHIYEMENYYTNNLSHKILNEMYSMGLRIVISKHIESAKDITKDDIHNYINEHMNYEIEDVKDSMRKIMLKQINFGIIDGKKPQYIDTFISILNGSKKETDSKNNVDNHLNELNKIYTSDALPKHLDIMYEIGVVMTYKKYDKKKMSDKINTLIEKYSEDEIDKIKDRKKTQLINELKQAIYDCCDDNIIYAFDSKGNYMYDYYNINRLEKRARIDAIKYKCGII